MASGWAPDGAVQDQVDDTVKDGVLRARARLSTALRTGESRTHCAECGELIPPARRQALPGARTCVECQSALDSRPVASGINRRGSKDSQLK